MLTLLCVVLAQASLHHAGVTATISPVKPRLSFFTFSLYIFYILINNLSKLLQQEFRLLVLMLLTCISSLLPAGRPWRKGREGESTTLQELQEVDCSTAVRRIFTVCPRCFFTSRAAEATALRGPRESQAWLARQVHRDLRGREAMSRSARTQPEDQTVPCACAGRQERTESL